MTAFAPRTGDFRFDLDHKSKRSPHIGLAVLSLVISLSLRNSIWSTSLASFTKPGVQSFQGIDEDRTVYTNSAPSLLSRTSVMNPLSMVLAAPDMDHECCEDVHAETVIRPADLVHGDARQKEPLPVQSPSRGLVGLYVPPGSGSDRKEV
ncbi:hypothetical protein CRG98_032960 [Punica granatum]|uniref:Uncharacterized protein n=1 Tax=Punica granatum TaxID=22663 RepID=A0A2I0IRJ4_PUNGR|nr:hypothetical protein CRG98_032960 [Punica granatum]